MGLLFSLCALCVSFTSCACSVHLHYLVFVCVALIWYTPYACIQFLELLVLLNSQSIHQFEYFFSDLILNVYIMYRNRVPVLNSTHAQSLLMLRSEI